jgi:hypothetical protein
LQIYLPAHLERNERRAPEQSQKHCSWVAICAASWVVAWAIAEAVPNFNLLLGLIAALFCSWFSCKHFF